MRRFNNAKLTMGLAAGAVMLCSMGAKAQDTTMSASTMTTMQPMAVSGTVLRYYVDRSGYVTAMDVQTANGTRMVRFMPGMAQRLTTMYPVGSTATVYVTESGGMTYLAGTGTSMPAPGAMMMPYTVTAVDILKSQPYTLIGAKEEMVQGQLTGYVTDEMGEVLAIVLDNTKLVRVPMESRQLTTMNVPEGITPLFKNADVVAIAKPEAPIYGVVSPFGSRWIASSISVGGRTLGAKGFGKLKTERSDTLFSWNIPVLGGSSPEEVQASNWGYSTYVFPGAATPAAAGAAAMPQ